MAQFFKEAMIAKVEEHNRSSFDKEKYKYTFRLIVWEIDPETGAKSVYDIIEQSGNKIEEISLGQILKGDEEEICISAEAHADVDFGKAKLLPSKINKILQSMA